jgi:hypothetical protein
MVGPYRTAKAPIDPRVLTDQQRAVHCQGLSARLDDGYAKCQAADDATLLRWEAKWSVPVVWNGPNRGLLAEYEAAVRELRARAMEG